MKRIFLLILAASLAAGCYKGTPDCKPGTVDYPRCEDLTQPSGPRLGASLMYPGATLLPNTGSTLGRPGIPLLIDSSSVSAVATYTSPTWAAEKYQKIIVEVDVNTSGFSYFRFQVNGDTGANYTDVGENTSNGAVAADSALAGNFARIGVAGNLSAGDMTVVAEFYPLTTGRTRPGHARSLGMAADLTVSYKRGTAFRWNNTATAVTSITLSVSGVTMTGRIRVWGVPG